MSDQHSTVCDGQETSERKVNISLFTQIKIFKNQSFITTRVWHLIQFSCTRNKTYIEGAFFWAFPIPIASPFNVHLTFKKLTGEEPG